MEKGNYDFKELDKLEAFCGWIPRLSCQRKDLFDGEQIVVNKDDELYFDAILHRYSYGHEDNLLEIMGDIVEDSDDTVEGFLTADEIILRIINDMFEVKENDKSEQT